MAIKQSSQCVLKPTFKNWSPFRTGVQPETIWDNDTGVRKELTKCGNYSAQTVLDTNLFN